MDPGNSNQADLALLLQQSDIFAPYEGYEPLNKTTRSIRLLRIRHESDGEIHASLTHASLDDEIEYEALSYCWGPPDVPKTIHVDHKPLLIRSSLHGFLDALCQNNQSLPVWVDTVCINQRDVHERNWQVSIMGDIYRRATRVKSWIGASDAHTDYAFAYMNCYRDEAFLSSSNFARAKERARESFQIILDRPYWKRLSINWELLLDAYKNDLSACKHLIHALRDLGEDSEEELAATAKDVFTGDASLDLLPSLPDTPKSSLLAQMSRFSTQACEDPKDRVFGMLGFARNGGQIAVDYTKSLADILVRVVLEAYYVSLMARSRTATRSQHDLARQKLGGLDRSIKASCLSSFLVDLTKHLLPTELFANPFDLFSSLSDMEDRLRICPRTYNNFLRRVKHGEVMVFNKDDESLLAQSRVLSIYNDFIVIVYWKSPEAVPRAIGSLKEWNGLFSGEPDVCHLLFQSEELKLCSRAHTCPNHRGDRFLEYENYGLLVHFSPFAILAILCYLSNVKSHMYIKTRRTFEGCLLDHLQELRKLYPSPRLCTCEVSPHPC